MPLIIEEGLVDKGILEKEKIKVLDFNDAVRLNSDIFNIAIVNLMPKKEETELHLLKSLNNSSYNLKVDFIRMDSYKSKNTSITRLKEYYKTLSDIKTFKYDGMIITGAPVEKIDYEDIKYWDELKELFYYSNKNVKTTLFICFAAQAALYYFYNIKNNISESKIFGIYEYEILEDDTLVDGFSKEFLIPHSRWSYVDEKDVERIKELKIISSREDTGVSLVKSDKKIFSFGHFEYDLNTLHNEYIRDLSKNIDIQIPYNYYVDNDINSGIRDIWKETANQFYSNWIDNYVCKK